MHFLFPSHPLKPSAAEPMFADQHDALRDAGFSVSLCPESVISARKSLRNIPAGSTVLYRGWMQKEQEYRKLTAAVIQASAVPLVSLDDYLSVHHCPNWYPLISEFTPETRFFPVSADIESELRALNWGEYFIKDYVKSLKTSYGSILRDPAEITSMLAEMNRIRGEIEGGLCVRRVEPFISETEKRFFVLHGKAFGASFGDVPEIVTEVARRIRSPFFSVDVIRREDGVLRIVEVGDGQVSDLVGWSVPAFVKMWKS